MTERLPRASGWASVTLLAPLLPFVVPLAFSSAKEARSFLAGLPGSDVQQGEQHEIGLGAFIQAGTGEDCGGPLFALWSCLASGHHARRATSFRAGGRAHVGPIGSDCGASRRGRVDDAQHCADPAGAAIAPAVTRSVVTRWMRAGRRGREMHPVRKA